MEEFADLLREIEDYNSDSNQDSHTKSPTTTDAKKKHHRSSKKSSSSKVEGGLSAKLLENQQLSFQLAADVRSLRQQLDSEKQAKRLLATTNVNLEAQLQKIEQKTVALEQALRISENRRFELQAKYDDEVIHHHLLLLNTHEQLNTFHERVWF